jgi:hypothetical protein
MPKKSLERSRPRLRRLLLLLLVTIPFVPEIAVYAIAVLAGRLGCKPLQTEACLIGSLPVSDVIGWALEASAGLLAACVRSSNVWLVVFYLAIAGWVTACYVVLTQSWANLVSRLLLGLAIALVFAFLPYFGPTLAVASLVNEHCQPNADSRGACKIFGGYVGGPNYTPAHATIYLWKLAPIGASLAIGIFVIYALALIALASTSAKKQAISK